MPQMQRAAISGPGLKSTGTINQAVIEQAEAINVLKHQGRDEEALHVEHEAIEMVLQSLGNAVLSGAPRPEVIEILNSAIEFCVLHFEDEEGFMRKHGYSGLAGHAAAHKRMLAKFRGMRRRATGSGISMATLDAVDLLHDFHEHVNTWDRCAFLAIENDPHGTVYSHRS